MHPKVLLVDDEHGFADILAARLDARGYPTLAAYDAAGGLKAVADWCPQVVVLDVNLPDRGGLEVLEEIARGWPLVQVVMLTGSSDLATAVEGMKLGALDYLVKPVDIEPLCSAIERAAQRRRDREEYLRMVETGKLAAMGRVAEGFAHEVLNPVNTILQKAGWARELLDDTGSQPFPDAGEVLAELEGIEFQARRCKALVAKLMSLGGRIAPRPERFSLADAVRSAIVEARTRAEAAGVSIELECGEGNWDVFLPRSEIEQVIERLVENALDALTLEGGMAPGGRVRVRLRRGEPGGVLIEVADNGPGVAPDIAERIFEPFFSTKDVGEGAGLGLSICHGIMKSLGGDVALGPEGPTGAVFTVTLPANGPGDGKAALIFQAAAPPKS